MYILNNDPDLALPAELEKEVNLYLPSLKMHIKKYGERNIHVRESLESDTGLFPIKRDMFSVYHEEFYIGAYLEELEDHFTKSIKKIYDSFGMDLVKSLLNNWENKFWDPKIHNYLMLDYDFHSNNYLKITRNISAHPSNHFINQFIQLINPNSLLDMNYVLGDYAFKNDFNRFLACTSSEYIYSGYKDIFGRKGVMKIADDTDGFEKGYEKINEKFDLIICSPPLPNTFSKPYESLYRRYLNQAFNKASKESFIVYIAPSDFIFHKQFKDHLKTTPFFLNGVLELDQKSTIGDDLPYDYKNFSVYLFSSTKTSVFFNSDLSVNVRNERMNTAIYNEFLRFIKDGKVLDYKKSDIDLYVGYKNSKWNAQLHKKFKNTNLIKLDFSETISEINVVESESNKYDDVPNSIYFRKNRINEAIFEDIKLSKNSIFSNLSLEEINSVKYELEELKRHQNYIQVTLKDEFDSEYVCGYFNSKIGVETLKINKEGSFQEDLSADSIQRIKVYFPNIKLQRKIAENSIQIKNQKLSLNETSLDLWSPKVYKDEKIFRRIERAKSIGESLKYWIDSLPFPLSSSLYHYISSNDVKVKHDQLLRFFESYTQFVVVIIVSALSNDKNFYQTHKKEISIENPATRNAGFGAWHHWYKKLRTFINSKIESENEEERIHIKNLISRGDEDFLNSIINGQITDILNRTLVIRNDSSGHGGKASELLLEKELKVLEKQLYKLRERIEYGFENFQIIIRGKTSSFEDSLHKYYDCKQLKGKGSPFNEIRVDSINPLETKELYYQIDEGPNLIKILPLIKYEDEIKAIYYFSKIKDYQGELKLKYVSHHYAENDEFLIEKTKEMEDLFDHLFHK